MLSLSVLQVNSVLSPFQKESNQLQIKVSNEEALRKELKINIFHAFLFSRPRIAFIFHVTYLGKDYGI